MNARYASFAFAALAATAASRAAAALADVGASPRGGADVDGAFGGVAPTPGIPRELNPACAHTLSIYLNAFSAKNFSVFIAAEHVDRNTHLARVAAAPSVPNAQSLAFNPRRYNRFTPTARTASNTASFFAIHSFTNSAGAATGIVHTRALSLSRACLLCVFSLCLSVPTG